MMAKNSFSPETQTRSIANQEIEKQIETLRNPPAAKGKRKRETGDAASSKRKCSQCKKKGHNKRQCPNTAWFQMHEESKESDIEDNSRGNNPPYSDTIGGLSDDDDDMDEDDEGDAGDFFVAANALLSFNK